MHKLISLASALLLVPTVTYSAIDIPVVAAATAKADLPKPPPKPVKVEKKLTTTGQLRLKSDNRSKIEVLPGVNEIVQVAVNHLNRIVTPYPNPDVRTTSAITQEIHDNVVYIGTSEESPVTLYITEEGAEQQAISLTLIPRKVPPREITLTMAGSLEDNSLMAFQTKVAQKWETSNSYVQGIYKSMATLAVGEVPSGYKLTNKPVGRLPDCRQAGLSFDFTSDPQSALGHHLIYHIGIMTNISPRPIEFKEELCGDWDIAGAGSFPLLVLNPGQSSEVFVAEKRNYKRSIKKSRRSLLVGK